MVCTLAPLANMIIFETKTDEGLTKAYFTYEDAYYEIDITDLPEEDIQERLASEIDIMKTQMSDEKILKIRESLETNQWVANPEHIQEF